MLEPCPAHHAGWHPRMAQVRELNREAEPVVVTTLGPYERSIAGAEDVVAGLTVPEYRRFRGWLTELALRTHKPVALADQLIERLRSDQIIVPPIQVVDRLCGEALARGTRVLYRVLTEPLDDDARARLDPLLTPLRGHADDSNERRLLR